MNQSLAADGVSRRTALGALLAVGAVPTLPAGVPMPPLTVFGPYDQAGLDAQYDNKVQAPNLEQVIERWSINSDDVRARLGEPLRRQYGATADEGIDIYRSSKSRAPMLIFLHGGGWRVGSAHASAYPAETFVRAGAHFLVPDFINVLKADGSIDAMLSQVRAAVAWAYRRARDFGGDGDRIHLVGHSSGAHLAALVAETDWHRDFGLPADVIKSALYCSGLYDLAAVSLSARRAYVRFSDAMVERLSPARRPQAQTCPVTLAYAALDSAEFQRQALEFNAALKSAGRDVTLIRGAGYNHFEFIETLANPYGLLGRAALQSMAR